MCVHVCVAEHSLTRDRLLSRSTVKAMSNLVDCAHTWYSAVVVNVVAAAAAAVVVFVVVVVDDVVLIISSFHDRYKSK